MRPTTLKLLVSVIAITIQSNSGSTIIPPYLQGLSIPVAVIGSLVSLGPVFALTSRLPIGLIYTHRRARLLIVAEVLVMGLSHFGYSVATTTVTFALIHALNGFAYGAATTLYMAFFVDSLPSGENRNHAMGYYVGSLAVGYSAGGFFGGWVADRIGYGSTFELSAVLSLIPVALLLLQREPGAERVDRQQNSGLTLRDSFGALIEPGLATVVIVALFLNLLHQMTGVFFSLYGLAVGLNLTQMGFMRAVVIVANAVGLVRDVPESKVRRGLASGIYNAAGDLGNILGPIAGGVIAQASSLGGVFIVGPIGSTILFLLGVFAVRQRRI